LPVAMFALFRKSEGGLLAYSRSLAPWPVVAVLRDPIIMSNRISS
jgi:hypothetical protein